MHPAELIIVLILVTTAIVSVAGFYNPLVQNRLIFSPERILATKEYYRLITPGLLHADWLHLLMNMYVLYAFGLPIARFYGADQLALIYLGSIVGGNLLALFIHRHHDYHALGASGGVCGVMFAYLFLFPGSGVNQYFIIPIPGWLFLPLFMVGSYYGIRHNRDNIGHDAHLGGAVIGLLITTALYPAIVRHSPILYALVIVLSLLIFAALVYNPLHLSWKAFTPPPRRREPRTASPAEEEARLDAILDKISKSGLQSLSRSEQEFLRRSSKKK